MNNNVVILGPPPPPPPLFIYFLYQLHTLTICKRFDRARSIACEALVCAGSIAYDLIACQAIASDQDSLDIIGCSDDRNNKSLVCAECPMTSGPIIWIDQLVVSV